MKRLAIPMLLAALLLPTSAVVHAQDERTATPSKGLLWGSKMTLEQEPCCTSPGRPADAAEAAAFKAAAGRAWRDGPVLRLQLQGNRSLKITDCDDENACEADRFRTHRLAAWWPKLGYYVIRIGLYEDSLAFLVSSRDGRTTQVAGIPVLSPSGRRAVALQSNAMNGVTLDLIDLSRDPPRVLEVVDMPVCPGARPDSLLRPKPVWIDETHVRFEGPPPQPGDDPATKQLLRVGPDKAQWQC